MLNKKILIIEDDHIVAGIYRNRLQVEGYQVEIATDGQQGIDKVASFSPNLVVLDLMLPKVNGVEVIKHIRSQSHLQQLPIIVFSNSYLSTMVQDAWKAGANSCLSKVNSTPKQVLEVIKNTLGTPEEETTLQATPPIEAPAPQVEEVPIRVVTPPPAPRAQPRETTSEADFLSEVRQSFSTAVPHHLVSLREMMTSFIKAPDDASRLNCLFDLYRKVHAITSNAGVAGYRQISEMTVALEALVKELYENPRNITPSTMRTLAQSIDFLGTLFQNMAVLDRIKPSTASILVVDDDVISRRAIVFALDKAHLKSVGTEDPEAALKQLNETHFDMIILDVDMPRLNGFQLCAQIRTLPDYADTPILFVTGLTDFENRTKSALSGGNDFIAKPFLFMEVAVKALTHILRSQLARNR